MVLPVHNPGLKMEEEESSHDPILQRLAKTDTFDSDWPTLRHHLHLALLSTRPIFQSRAPPAAYQFPPDTPSRPSNPTPTSPTPSPLSAIKPGSPFASASVPPSSSLLLSRSPFSKSTLPPDEQPSTLGGLVIPPFPPLDPERRNNRRLSAGAIGPVPPAVVARMNGHSGAGGQAGALARGNVYEDEWDEAVVIGGKKLTGWMEEDEGKKEVERVGKIIDELEEPPFTIQRLAELLLNPTKHHTTLGKFLRALEKNLLVTTSWSAPSYVAEPPSTFSGSRGLFGPTSSPSTSSASSSDSNSTMPIGSTTPMFSPIPFLVRPPFESDLSSGMDIDSDLSSDATRVKGEDLMSPLILNDKQLEAEITNTEDEKEVADQTSLDTSSTAPSSGRSQTPEPEETSSRPTQPQPIPIAPIPLASQPQPESLLTGSESSDPAHQPYLGRVDELDTGPITQPPADAVPTNGSGVIGQNGGSDEGMGTGEGGNMTPHGMSDKPVPISATTTVGVEEERKVAGLPRTKSVVSLAERFEPEKPGEVAVEGNDQVDEGSDAKKAKLEEKEVMGEIAKEEQEGEGESMDIEVEVEVKSSTVEEGKVEEKDAE